MYKFQLDTYITKMIYITGKNENLSLISSRENYRISINLKKEPYSFNVHKFEYYDFNDILYDDSKIYIARNNELIILKDNFEYYDKKKTDYGLLKLTKYGNHFILIASMNSMNYLKVTDGDLNALFVIPICTDMIDNIFIKGNKVYMTSFDKNIYIDDINKELIVYRNRILMKEEDRQSLQYMAYLLKESKKKGKGKSGKKTKPPSASTIRSKSLAPKGESANSKPSSALSKITMSKPSTAKSRISESVKSAKSAKSGNTVKSGTSSNLEVIKDKKAKPKPKGKKK